MAVSLFVCKENGNKDEGTLGLAASSPIQCWIVTLPMVPIKQKLNGE